MNVNCASLLLDVDNYRELPYSKTHPPDPDKLWDVIEELRLRPVTERVILNEDIGRMSFSEVLDLPKEEAVLFERATYYLGEQVFAATKIDVRPTFHEKFTEVLLDGRCCGYVHSVVADYGLGLAQRTEHIPRFLSKKFSKVSRQFHRLGYFWGAPPMNLAVLHEFAPQRTWLWETYWGSAEERSLMQRLRNLSRQ